MLHTPVIIWHKAKKVDYFASKRGVNFFFSPTDSRSIGTVDNKLWSQYQIVENVIYHLLPCQSRITTPKEVSYTNN